MTLRRLLVLVRALPATAAVWAEQRAVAEKALKPTVEDIKARQEHYRLRGKGAA